jgi:hypothetical protein
MIGRQPMMLPADFSDAAGAAGVRGKPAAGAPDIESRSMPNHRADTGTSWLSDQSDQP